MADSEYPPWYMPRDVISEFISSPRGVRAFEGMQTETVGTSDSLANASFLTLTSEPVLGTERVFTPDAASFDISDGGANATYSISLKTISVTPGSYGAADKVPSITVDAKGRITSASETTITTTAIGAVPTSRTITAGTGLTGGGDLSANRSLAVVSAGTYGLPTGTLARAIFATYTAPVISAAPTQAEVQAIADALQVVSRTLAALITDMKANGNLS